MKSVKVVILNWNGVGHLKRFLPSVLATTPGHVQIVVADNGSTDESEQCLLQEFPEVLFLPLDKNYGFAQGYNLALNKLEADYFILLNSDVETSKGWCEPLIAALEQDERVAAASPKILSYTDKHSFEYAGASGGFIDMFGYPFCRGRVLNTIENDHGQYDDARDVFWTSGACMIVRSDLFRNAGGFDASFFAHMEEIDLCWRLHLMGYKLMVIPESKVYHIGGGTLSTDNPRKTYLNFRNSLCMLYKNLPHSKRYILPIRMLLDGASAIVYLVTGRKKLFSAVWSAHSDFRKMKGGLRISREGFRAEKTTDNAPCIYRGSILARYFLGRKTFGGLM